MTLSQTYMVQTRTRRARHLLALAVLALSPATSFAQAPQYRTDFLGPATAGASVADLNQAGVLVGTVTIAGNQRAYVASPTQALTALPLPPGRISSWANGINDQGVIVGRVGSSYSPEFSGVAALWTPNGSGGYTVQELGVLPGHTASSATALNNVGDVVGWSFNGSYRLPARFFAGAAPQSLQSTGIFDPQSINDSRVIIDRSADGKLLDLNTMLVQSLGVPQGQPNNYNAVTGYTINAAGQVSGVAILATSTSCVQQSARYTGGIGWEIFGPCGNFSGVADMNDLGEMTMVWTLTPVVQLNGFGTFVIEDLISAPVGHWYVSNYAGFRINNARQLVGPAHNPTTGESGLLLLTLGAPVGTAFCFGDGTGTACPCGNSGAPGNGCAHSLNAGGANLSAAGLASLASDSVVLTGVAMPNSSALYFQGTAQQNGGLGSLFGDGLRCAGGTTIRLGTKANAGGASQYPGALDPSISVGGLVTAPGTRTYQVWYRNAAAFCTAAAFNLTNGLSISWAP
jgi:hypothetical protein